MALISGGSFLCIDDFLDFAVVKDWVFLLGTNFCDFLLSRNKSKLQHVRKFLPRVYHNYTVLLFGIRC